MNITVTLHLPGLKKTVQYSYDSIPNKYLTDRIAAEFGQELRRSNVFLLSEGFFETIRANDLWLTSTPPVKNGDTLILCVRKTTHTNQNEYYEAQNDVLSHNTHLNPPLTKDIAIDLLTQIKINFELLGHKYYLPGTFLHKYRKSLDEELSQWYPEK